jgi:predicted amidohydrolase
VVANRETNHRSTLEVKVPIAEIRIASAQYPVDRLGTFAEFEAKLAWWVAEAAAQGAELLVFPEYGSMELASLFGPEAEGNIQEAIDAITSILPQVDDLHAALARRHGVHIVAASAAVRRGRMIPNTARLFTPAGEIGIQDKRIMTPGEREWGVTPDGPVRAFETRLGIIGVAICYDVEFPLIARAQVAAGAQVIVAPSCTETIAGYNRVRIGAMARALENQCISVQSPLVGEAPWSAAVERNRGMAAVYGPPDRGFAEDGIIAVGRLDEPRWVYGAADLAAIDLVRREGMVLNHRHWEEQGAAPPAPAELVTLL